MRSSLAIAALAAGALAIPFANHEKRGIVNTAYDVVYVTDVVTVTGDGSPKPAKQTPANAPQHYGHHNGHSPAVYTTVTSSSSSSPPPVYKAPATYAASKPKSTPSNPTGAAPTGYNDLVVYHHNLHRANHSCPDVEWSDDLYSSALEIAQSCVYAHNTKVQGGGYGQNIAAGVEPANISAIITDLFYNGEEPYFASQYGKDNPDMTDFEKWGHFSQIVWKGTTHVACATQHCPGGLANVGSGVSPYFTVCNYKNPGNFHQQTVFMFTN